ncbi:hypothetical protein CPC08DRAFT_522095 [Agrocybe pediades]|nr:hypothetical protein CPC08DRAFT_522095 [Agrocybe pediades]
MKTLLFLRMKQEVVIESLLFFPSSTMTCMITSPIAPVLLSSLLPSSNVWISLPSLQTFFFPCLFLFVLSPRINPIKARHIFPVYIIDKHSLCSFASFPNSTFLFDHFFSSFFINITPPLLSLLWLVLWIVWLGFLSHLCCPSVPTSSSVFGLSVEGVRNRRGLQGRLAICCWGFSTGIL